MVTSVRIALALVGCLSLVGCAAEPTQKAEIPVDDSKVTAAPKNEGSDDSSDDGSDSDLPVTPVVADDDNAVPTTEDCTPPAQGGGASEKPPTGTGTGTGTGTATPTTKTQSCTSTSGSYKALTTVTYTVSSGSATISKVTVNVTNPDNRDQNDVDVYVNNQKAFNSGDILKHGQTITVPQASSMKVTTGTKVKFETNFDKQFLTDPSASCEIQF